MTLTPSTFGWCFVLAGMLLPGLSAQTTSTAPAGDRDALGTNHVKELRHLGLTHLPGPIEAYYSFGAKNRAEKLQAAIRDMNSFYQEQMGVKAEVALAVLDPIDWKKIAPAFVPYGLPCVDGRPPVIFMSTGRGFVYHDLLRLRDAVPPKNLRVFLEANHTTFEATVDQFVDFIGFHELGHELTASYRIAPPALWLDELAATYFAHAYVSERQPELKGAFELLARPPKKRPPNATLEDFERLYLQVDDYGWYQGLFETRVRELYPRMGLKFLKDLRREFPVAKSQPAGSQPTSSVSPSDLLARLEKIAPGFQTWAQGFGP